MWASRLLRCRTFSSPEPTLGAPTTLDTSWLDQLSQPVGIAPLDPSVYQLSLDVQPVDPGTVDVQPVDAFAF
jgi:hypothetical protein